MRQKPLQCPFPLIERFGIVSLLLYKARSLFTFLLGLLHVQLRPKWSVHEILLSDLDPRIFVSESGIF